VAIKGDSRHGPPAHGGLNHSLAKEASSFIPHSQASVKSSSRSLALARGFPRMATSEAWPIPMS
jgi:hypothetical protein